MFEGDKINNFEVGTIAGLKQIHWFWFQDVFEFAGQENCGEMNVAHPFREGNGRAMRIWLDLMLKKRLGKCVDWAKISKEEYLSAMERSPVNDLGIRVLLEWALTTQINDKEVYMRGIQFSYAYENQKITDS